MNISKLAMNINKSLPQNPQVKRIVGLYKTLVRLGWSFDKLKPKRLAYLNFWKALHTVQLKESKGGVKRRI